MPSLALALDLSISMISFALGMRIDLLTVVMAVST